MCASLPNEITLNKASPISKDQNIKRVMELKRVSLSFFHLYPFPLYFHQLFFFFTSHLFFLSSHFCFFLILLSCGNEKMGSWYIECRKYQWAWYVHIQVNWKTGSYLITLVESKRPESHTFSRLIFKIPKCTHKL